MSKWTENSINKGVQEYKLSSWKYFSDFINEEMLDHTGYVYRGHANSEWKLEPTIDRVIKKASSKSRDDHLTLFKYETRGRRGPNPAQLNNENDWWALGQHHGLLTPLLDWTESPFVALYFAASSAESESGDDLAVFAFDQDCIKKSNKYIRGKDVETINNHKPTVKIVRPLSDENSRLVNQRGLFTRGPNNIDIESWVMSFNQDPDEMHLIKITIPKIDIKDCLRYLNRMNINNSSLFPDLSGASNYCNTHLHLKDY